MAREMALLGEVAELTAWSERMRLIVRRVNTLTVGCEELTTFEERNGRRYQITATNFPAHQGLSGVPGSGQVWFVDALY
ncbi:MULTISPECIES: hypothetical protein [Streptomyces]|uniref:hypothetical protein n=1 Tax=Streptomyces TaxID=1883 RepID=UPI00142F474E|nr:MULTISPECIES: hypothetical protein [Streptomyces]MCH0559029.1 hypothetical protein [Streptomyces sp. MUM 16J]